MIFLPDTSTLLWWWAERISQDRFQELAITSSHALRAGSLPGNHRDPFDRMIAAQGILEGLPVLTTEATISELGAEQIW